MLITVTCHSLTGGPTCVTLTLLAVLVIQPSAAIRMIGTVYMTGAKEGAINIEFHSMVTRIVLTLNLSHYSTQRFKAQISILFITTVRVQMFMYELHTYL